MIQLNIKNIDPKTTKTDCLIVFVGPQMELGPQGQQLNKACKNDIKHQLRKAQLPDQIGAWRLLNASSPLKAQQVLAISLGSSAPLRRTELHTLLHQVDDLLTSLNLTQAGCLIEDITLACQQEPTFEHHPIEQIANVLLQKHYRFDRFKTQSKSSPKSKKHLTFYITGPLTSARAALKYAQCVSQGMQLTQDLGNMPGNLCHPTYLLQQARALAKQHANLSCQAISEKQLEKLGAHAFLAVSKGSDQPGQLIIMTYNGLKTKRASKEGPIVLVGKGVTFDSGGISIKPSAKMDEMKFDMCGAGTVIGVMHAIASMQLPIHLIGVVAAAENMPSGNATRPGDIVKTLSGQTVEILNTDAEGRLVLCDALTYIERFKPKTVIDMATLTGACIVALGHHQSAVLGNHQPLVDDLINAGRSSDDLVWQLPLNADYEAQLKSETADMANIGTGGAGTVTAAAFLSKFTKKYQWAHLDIAGTAWKGKSATGRPVPLLCQYLRDQNRR